jgi:hypothetical protein
MVMDSINLASAPVDEECAQLGSDGYYERAKRECNAFIRQLRREFGDEPVGARLYIKSQPHDFGSYYEVECKFDEKFPKAIEYAFELEANLPENWDEEAKQELQRV